MAMYPYIPDVFIRLESSSLTLQKMALFWMDTHSLFMSEEVQDERIQNISETQPIDS